MPITQVRMIRLLEAVGDYEKAFNNLAEFIQNCYSSSNRAVIPLTFDEVDHNNKPINWESCPQPVLAKHVEDLIKQRDIWKSQLDTIAANAVHQFMLTHPIQSSQVIAVERKHFNDHARDNARSAANQRKRRRGSDDDTYYSPKLYKDILETPKPRPIPIKAQSKRIFHEPLPYEGFLPEGGAPIKISSPSLARNSGPRLSEAQRAEIDKEIEYNDAMKKQLAKMEAEVPEARGNVIPSQVALDDLKRMDEEDDALGDALLGESNLGVGGKRGG